MKHEFLPMARLEFLEAVSYYELQREGLGDAFTDEVYATIARIGEDPSRWRVITAGARRCFTHTFPYAVIYRAEDQGILIIAVAHGSRRPGYWIQRARGD
jgi:plasmid stabilization system protein ParE